MISCYNTCTCILHSSLFFRMLATTSIIFAVAFVVYGGNGQPTSEEKVNNPELTQLDTF